MSKDKTVRVTVRGADSVALEDLVPFQGELKRLDRGPYEQLRSTIMKDGFGLVLHVWENEGLFYIIDGHQRVTALKMMAEEGIIIPKLPVSLIEAASFADAKRRVLAAAAQYGKMTERSLAKFLEESEITFDDVVASFRFPEVDLHKMMKDIGGVNLGPQVEMASSEDSGMRHSSGGVKQVQLFYDSADHEEFMRKAAALAEDMKIDNISDALLAVVREAHNSL